MKEETRFQSAAKPQNNYGEGSETISRESTPEKGGSATPLTDNAEGDNIVQKKNRDKFIEKATKRYNGKFDYSKAEYVDAKTKVTIICPIHGEFSQTPDKHLRGKFGCFECSKESKINNITEEIRKLGNDRHRITKEEFIERANKKYNNKFEYEINDWKGICDSIIIVICPIHGKFETNARNHILYGNETGCPECGVEKFKQSRTRSYDEVIEELKKIHKETYEYPESNRDTYINKKSKLTIICKVHGKFIKTAQKHLIQGCPKCERKGNYPGGYNEEFFRNHPELKDIPANIYYFKINNGQYYKIGISIHDPKNRAKGIKSLAKSFGETLNIEIIGSRKLSLYDAFTAEQAILRILGTFRVYTKWSTEIFNTDIYEYIKELF